MTHIFCTDTRRQALADVYDGKIVYYPDGCIGRMLGFYWAATCPGGCEATICPSETDALTELVHAHLITIGPPPARRVHGNPVLATREGARRLSEWNHHRPVRGAW